MTVEEFVAMEATRANYPGACCIMVDRWIMTRLGYSALRRYGRLVETEADVKQWLNEPGGIAVGVNRVMRACGIRKTASPVEGDVGLVVAGRRGTAEIVPLSMAILGKRGWHSRNSMGLLMAPRDAIWKAWAI